MLPENVNWNAVLQSITDTWFPLEKIIGFETW